MQQIFEKIGTAWEIILQPFILKWDTQFLTQNSTWINFIFSLNFKLLFSMKKVPHNKLNFYLHETYKFLLANGFYNIVNEYSKWI